MMKHTEIEELLGAFALDAVDPDEAAEIERHLTGCPRCRAEVASHMEVAAALGNGGASEAPEGLWGRIVAALEEPPEGEVGAPVIGLDEAREAREAHPGLVGPPARARSLRVLVAVAAAAAVLVGALGVQVVRQGDRIDRLASAVDDRGVEGAAVSAALASDARRVALRGDDGRLLVSAVVRPDGQGYLAADALPELPSSRTYQLWAMVGGTPVSVGVLGPDPAVVAFRAPARFDALALTEEPAGGAPAPTQAPFASGPVPIA